MKALRKFNREYGCGLDTTGTQFIIVKAGEGEVLSVTDESGNYDEELAYEIFCAADRIADISSYYGGPGRAFRSGPRVRIIRNGQYALVKNDWGWDV